MSWKAGLEYEQEEVGFYLCDEAGQVVLSSDVRPSADVIRLIEAAPDLLELLKEVRTTLEMWKDVAPAISLCNDIDRTIAKAKGEAL